jgi:hypothetical protein
MVPKSKNHKLTIESKSKRTALGQKYKIQRKVREHNRKVRKDSKGVVAKSTCSIANVRKERPRNSQFVSVQREIA